MATATRTSTSLARHASRRSRSHRFWPIAAASFLALPLLLATTGSAQASRYPVPKLTITSQPASPTISKSATIQWTTDATWSFTSLDGKSWVADPDETATYSNLSTGTHQVDVKAVNSYGQTVRTSTWTISVSSTGTTTTSPVSTTSTTPTSGTTQSGTQTQTGSSFYLSDLPAVSSSNGWGPIEKDRSNGERAAGDGRTLTLNGTTYAKGIGVHSASDIRYNLGGLCTSFQASVGLDDEVGSLGSVVFQVFADGSKLYDSGPMTGSTATKALSVSVSAKSTLQLVVTTNGDINFDHADWANARVSCSSAPSGGTTSTGGSTGTTGSTGTGTTQGTTGGTTSGGTTSGGTTSSTSVAAPLPPSSYTIPAGAVRVTTSAQLLAELAKSPRDIVLADGTYDNSTYFTLGSHRLYAENVGKAVLKAGLQTGTSGWRVQGLTLNVTSIAKTLNNWGGALATWGSGKNGMLLDTTFDGGFSLKWGALLYANDGTTVARIVARNYTDGGLYLYDNSIVPYGGSVQRIASVSDLDLSGFAWASPGASNMYEGGLFVGQPVTGGVNRVRVRDVGRKCVETFGNAWNTTFSNLDLDPSGSHAGSAQLGVYLEHYSYGITFQDFVIRAGRGFNAEWDNGQTGKAATSGYPVSIRRGVIDATNRPSPFVGGSVGVYLDQGNSGMVISNVTFRGQTRAALNEYRTISSSTLSGVTYQSVTKQFSSASWTSAP